MTRGVEAFGWTAAEPSVLIGSAVDSQSAFLIRAGGMVRGQILVFYKESNLMDHKSVGFIAHVLLGESQQKTFGKGRPFRKTLQT